MRGEPAVQTALLAETKVNFRALVSIASQVVGRSPAEAADRCGRQLSDAERFCSCLADIREQGAKPGLNGLAEHVSLTFAIAADDFELPYILEVVGGHFVLTPARSGAILAIVTATLAQWASACERKHLTDVSAACYRQIKAKLMEYGVH